LLGLGGSPESAYETMTGAEASGPYVLAGILSRMQTEPEFPALEPHRSTPYLDPQTATRTRGAMKR
jgi:hypothetical protein